MIKSKYFQIFNFIIAFTTSSVLFINALIVLDFFSFAWGMTNLCFLSQMFNESPSFCCFLIEVDPLLFYVLKPLTFEHLQKENFYKDLILKNFCRIRRRKLVFLSSYARNISPFGIWSHPHPIPPLASQPPIVTLIDTYLDSYIHTYIGHTETHK